MCPPQAQRATSGPERAWPLSQPSARISPAPRNQSSAVLPHAQRPPAGWWQKGLVTRSSDSHSQFFSASLCRLPGMGLRGDFLACQILEISLHRSLLLARQGWAFLVPNPPVSTVLLSLSILLLGQIEWGLSGRVGPCDLGRSDGQPGNRSSSRPLGDGGHVPWRLDMLILFFREGSVGKQGEESSGFSRQENSCSPPQSDPRLPVWATAVPTGRAAG